MNYVWQNDSVEESIRSHDDILLMLDSLLRDESQWWDSFYSDRSRRVPFFVNNPDECLVDWFCRGELNPGKVLELGCGPGRNAIYMAKQGCEVDAVDSSPVSIDWAKERATEELLEINFACQSIFDFPVDENTYDIVYDAGCFHHIPPHRRMSFLSLVNKALKPGGAFALVCMGAASPEEFGGADISDWQVYRDRSMHGGLGYSEERLKSIFSPTFDVLEFRQMKKCVSEDGLFGEPFLWVALFRKR